MLQEPFYYLTFYHFVTLDSPESAVKKHKDYLKNRDIKCRIYFSKEGVNAVLSGRQADAEHYMEWLKSDPRFADVWFKIHTGQEHSLPHQTVKKREQLVAMDMKVDLKQTGAYMTPEQWAETIEKRDENTLIIDVRNKYESDVGYFEGAERPSLTTFRDFPKYVSELKKRYDGKKTKVLTYCTGGIRCELYTVLLKNEGFEHVHQLHGGVVNYGQQMGGKHWRGKLFMFDDRLAIPLAEGQKEEVVSSCHHCKNPADVFYNCAHMSCNALFIGCPECVKAFEGCCCESCKGEDHRRPFVPVTKPKPFRRLSHASNSCSL